MKKLHRLFLFCSLPIGLSLSSGALAQVSVNDTLTGAASTYPWKAQGGACLTAGTNPSATPVPGCKGLPAYSGKTQVGGNSGVMPDSAGVGALRLTNGDTTANGSNGNSITGAVISTLPFPTNQGVQITFSTVTYGGNAYQNGAGAKSGADGMAFFLMDGSQTPSTGAFGGSLGYACSNVQTGTDAANGVNGGYLGVGIDEFGNFSNPGDSTSDGPGVQPNYIVVRGAGSITYAALNQLNSVYYPSANLPGSADTTTKANARLAAVHATCASGKLVNWSSKTITDKNGSSIKTQTATTEPVLDYKLLASKKVPTTIYTQEAVSKPVRTAGTVLNYNLVITKDGLLSLSYTTGISGSAVNSVISNQSITAGNGPLPSSFLFGFTGSTGGGSNVHEITCFKAAPIDAAANSAGSNVLQASALEAGTQVYLGSYHPLNYWGQLTATSFTTDSSGNLSIAATPNWDASCVLTGGACASLSTTTSNVTVTAEDPTVRRILSFNGQGVDFLGLSNLSSTQQTAIGGSTDGANRIAYLRGDRTNELTSSGTGVFRHRDGVLGDIRNSSPTWVGPPSSSYAAAGVDTLYTRSIAEFGASYAGFASTNETRPHVVYIGANDGMLHGFRAGAYNASGVYSNTNNDGKEVLAYVPDMVINSIHPTNIAFDFSSPQYAHNAYVDATPGTGDLYYNGAWHTWLVGGLGAGGMATGEIVDSTSTANGVIYALDITNSASFASATAASLVIGEWNSSNITCVNDGSCNTKLGSGYGTPIVRLLHDGNWAVIFGNGRNSAAGAAGVFIMSVNRATGAITTRYLDTNSSNASNKNSIDYVAAADLDGDHVSDYLYAGDTAGNLWRFDLTSNDPTKWAAGSAPLFTTPSGQPISTAVTINRISQANVLPRIIVGFGTGRLASATPTQSAVYATGTQSLYGIWDWNMAAWNAKGSAQYVSLSSASVSTPVTVANLAAPVVTDQTSGTVNFRVGTSVIVCWSGSSTCASPKNTQFGWTMALPDTSEQIIFNPTSAFNTFFVNTTIPAVNQTLSCVTQPASGFSMAVTIDTGSAPDTSAFSTEASNLGINNTVSGTGIVGIGFNATGTSSFITTGSGTTAKTYMYGQTVSGSYYGSIINPSTKHVGKRLTWVKLK